MAIEFVPAQAMAAPAPGFLRRLRRALRGDPLALAGLVVLLGLLVMAVFGSRIAPYPAQGEGASDVAARMLPRVRPTSSAPTSWAATS